MKTLIIYASKTGTTTVCAKLLSEKLTNSTLWDITSGDPDLSLYNLIIIGSVIRMGKINKSLNRFINSHLQELLLKKTAFFFSNYYPEKFEKAVTKNIPSPLRDTAVCITSLGGVPPFFSMQETSWLDKQNFDTLIHLVQNSYPRYV